ncbi:hypothetical protein AVEN_21471-1 [Araneus ventricosus]|uniref:Integrase catalytic domain-containing protein n=1 Tax=Araneus ventricosus TaxID=182803 RepID=A0A4Y2EM56_ARAVE|nr:hypothetical protein AVEN_21471-1 [Araneus ventricosus]
MLKNFARVAGNFLQEFGQVGQVRRAITYRDRIPIQPIVRPENPFDVWSVDCIGSLEPPSRRGHKFVICAFDICTRWAEAIPVRNITAKATCDVLWKIFTATGFPEVICTDQVINFTALLTKEFLKVIGVLLPPGIQKAWVQSKDGIKF